MGAIAVVDEGGHLLALERIDCTFAAAADISVGKARTAAHFRKPTRFFEEVIGKGRAAMVTVADVTSFTPLQGGVPVVIDGQIVGAVGVSGADSAQADEEIAIVAASALGSTAAAPVAYYDKDIVASAFAKGAVLFENAAANYAVHASRRTAPGQAEVHNKETDVIHVLEGSATFVTGGSVVDGKETAPDEIRGREIRGGDARTITKGDVIIVPAGTPHWFKEVSGVVHYYVVKVK